MRASPPMRPQPLPIVKVPVALRPGLGASPRSSCSEISLMRLRPGLLQNRARKRFGDKTHSATLIYTALRNGARNQRGFAQTSFSESSGPRTRSPFVNLACWDSVGTSFSGKPVLLILRNNAFCFNHFHRNPHNNSNRKPPAMPRPLFLNFVELRRGPTLVSLAWWGFASDSFKWQLPLVGLRPDVLQNTSSSHASFPQLHVAAPKPYSCQRSLVGLNPDLFQMAT